MICLRTFCRRCSAAGPGTTSSSRKKSRVARPASFCAWRPRLDPSTKWASSHGFTRTSLKLPRATVTLVAEIPVGYHTGEHAHGEKAIHIVAGEGFSVVNGTRYDWAAGSTMWMPFGSRHQHFNTGPRP